MVTINSTQLRKGTVFRDQNKVFFVLNYKHVKKGRGLATVRVKVKDVESGAIVEKTFSSNEKVEEESITYKKAQYLYSDKEYGYFMDSTDFSQFQVDIKMLGEDLKFLTEGLKVNTLWLGDKVVGIELPKKVTLKVKNTEPGIAGDTQGSATKKAELETGLEVQVPLFVNRGDKIIVNCELGTYVSKG